MKIVCYGCKKTVETPAAHSCCICEDCATKLEEMVSSPPANIAMALVNVVAVLIGAWLLSGVVGVRVAAGIGFIAWALLPPPAVWKNTLSKHGTTIREKHRRWK